ncbi:MAG: hypothetical protein K0S46_1898 [Moraxellaceae bacterium]|jgi:hypothetical protein|nr:hypothetical protein [Moraxellaceae bacterium]
MYPAGLKEMLSAALDDLEAAPKSRIPRVAATREAICEELRLFGEEAVADAIKVVPRHTLTSIFDLAGELHAKGSASSAGHSLCLAAVTIVEGKARPLARKRRRRAS